MCKREAASAVITRQLADDLRLQVKHYKVLSQANSAANCDADSKEESEGGWEEADGSTAAAVNCARCFSCVSSSITPSSTPIVVPVPTYLSLAKTSQISDIPPFAATKHGRKIAQKAKITLVRKQQIVSYLSMQSSSNTVSRKTPAFLCLKFSCQTWAVSVHLVQNPPYFTGFGFLSFIHFTRY